MNQKIIQGYGVTAELNTILEEFSPSKVFLVTGKNSYIASGAKVALREVLNNHNIVRFDDFSTNPRLEDIEKGIDLFKSEDCDFIIGIGGGSVIDTAKAISILSSNTGKSIDYVTGVLKPDARKTPVVVIPTTAGTGSESTHFSTIYVESKKYSLAHLSMVPDYAVCDPALTEKSPAYLTAYTNMDALCQAIESFWSVNSTDESRTYSIEAIKLILPVIIKNVTDPDKKTREKSLQASNLAGRAINIAQTTAPHAISYSLTAYFNVPHGHAVALTMPGFFNFNCNVTPEDLVDTRGSSFVLDRMNELLDVMEVKSAELAKEKILFIMKSINLKTRFSDLGIDIKDIEMIIKNGYNPQRMKNNPKSVTESDLRNILYEIL